jgi:uncharacterized membrane protein
MSKQRKQESNLIAILSYFGLLFLIPMLVVKDDSFVQFHAKQGLVLFLFEAATAIFAAVPILGWLGAPILYIFWIVLSIIGIINVVNNKKEQLPVIGQLADRFKI